jgi:hypothetical protein
MTDAAFRGGGDYGEGEGDGSAGGGGIGMHVYCVAAAAGEHRGAMRNRKNSK